MTGLGGLIDTLGLRRRSVGEGRAAFSRLDLERGERCATLEIKINDLAVVTDGSVRADATLLRRGRPAGGGGDGLVLHPAGGLRSRRWR
jgi:hypothetical protein